RLEAAKAMLTASLTTSTDMEMLDLQLRQKQENQLGEVFTLCALLQAFQENAEAALPFCQQALALLSADNLIAHAFLAYIQLWVYFTSSLNDSVASIESGLQAISLAQATGQVALLIGIIGSTAGHMELAGRLHEAEQL